MKNIGGAMDLVIPDTKILDGVLEVIEYATKGDEKLDTVLLHAFQLENTNRHSHFSQSPGVALCLSRLTIGSECSVETSSNSDCEVKLKTPLGDYRSFSRATCNYTSFNR